VYIAKFRVLYDWGCRGYFLFKGISPETKRLWCYELSTTKGHIQ